MGFHDFLLETGSKRSRHGFLLIDAIVTREFSKGFKIFDGDFVLHDSGGVEDVAAVGGDFVDNFFCEGADFVGGFEGEEIVGDAAADGEFVMDFFGDQYDVVLIDMINDGGGGEFKEAVEVGEPFSFGVKEDLVTEAVEFKDDGLEGGPKDGFEMFLINEGDAAAVHPESDGDLLVGIDGGFCDVVEVGHEGFGGGEYFFRLFVEVRNESEVTAEFVGEDVERGFEDSGDGGDGSRLAAEFFDLGTEGGEVLHHGHAAFEEGEIVSQCGGLSGGDDLGGDAREPDLEEKSRWIRDERIVFIGEHEGVVFGRFAVLEGGIFGDVEAGDAVVFAADGVSETGPDINHVCDDGVPVEVRGAFACGVKGEAVIVSDLLAGVAGVFGGEFRDEGADGDAVGVFVSQGGGVSFQPVLIEGFLRCDRLRFERFHAFSISVNGSPV